MPYIKDVSNSTERIVAGLGVGIAHRFKATMCSKIMRMKEKLNPTEQSWGSVKTGQTGRMLVSHIHEHKLVVRRGDGLSQVAAHNHETGHELNFAAKTIIAHAGCQTRRELLEAWVSDENSVNRFIDVAPAYRVLHVHLWTGTTGV
ncbi:unnamed protein product [Schistocephalus solidus]|uniref:Tox-ART-HYD1 domain-containing protein n=1 Tax=Schistocephalus solidus TaxID=70667 RepID=A0A183TJ93_SCHSO|nr:unnamed protein product [Schistocephalus solidus]